MSTGSGNDALRLFLFCTGSRLAADEDDSSGNAVTGFDSIVDGDCATDGDEAGGSGDDVVDDLVDGTIESVVVVAVNAAADGVSPLSLILLLPALLLVTASMSDPAPAIRAYTSSY